MNFFISQRTSYFALGFSLIFVFLHAKTYADVSYSWSGTLELANAGGNDPWLIGVDGATFMIQTTVSGMSGDIDATQVPFAQFIPIASRLLVDNEEVGFVDGARIDFADSDNVADLITANGRFERFGQEVEIGSVISLPPSTYSFTLEAEVPPIFRSILTTGIGKSIHSPYVATVNSGTFVIVTPDPTGVMLCIVGFAAFSGGSTSC
jgi:hypothetical protein